MTVEQRFAQARPRLLRLAYSQLGDFGEAEDVVQEAWLRLERAGAQSIDDLDAWLTVVVGRLALDALRSARARRETYVGPWLPEPLHDIFEVPFQEVADVVGRRPEAVRQLASRARRHIAQQRPRFEASRSDHDRAVRAFARAIADGDLAELVAVLDPNVVWTTDGGGRATAARKPLLGAQRVARAWLALRRRPAIEATATPVELNGRLGLMIDGTDGHPMAVSFVVENRRIARIDAVRNPDKLRRVPEGP
jgi:RNA polymerase sigma-70 factor, ECF subfamily